MKIRSRLSIVWLLTGLNLFNYLDRYVVNAVSPRIRDDFHIGLGQTGWVVSAFMIGYFLTSPIFGTLGDRYPRKGLIAFGVMVWSLATAASGFAGGFWVMIGARIFVGVGEASYATLSPTIIDDLADSSSKNRLLGIFYAAMPVGCALGYALGGFLENAFHSWRAAFYIAGAPGIILALLVLTIDEPPRTSGGGSGGHHTSFYGSIGELFVIPGYLFAVLGYVAYTFALGAFAFAAPQYLEAHLGMELDKADFWLGVILAATGFGGTAVGGLLGDRWMPRLDRTRAALSLCAWSTALAAPFAVLTLMAGTPLLFFFFIGVTEFFLFVSTAPVNAALLGAVPSSLRASAMAMSIFAIHLFGDLISPPALGAIAQVIMGSTPKELDHGASLHTAMFILPAMIALGAILWAVGARAPKADIQPAPAEAG